MSRSIAVVRLVAAIALVISVVIGPAAHADERTARAPDRRTQVSVRDDGSFTLSKAGGAEIASGVLPQVPDEVAVLDGGRGFVAIDSALARGRGDALVLIDGRGRLQARLGMDELFDQPTLDAFWAPDDVELAWRVDWWIDEPLDVVVIIPDRPGQPVAVSLADGLVENPDPSVFVRRMEARGLWFGSRLRALELAVRYTRAPDGMMPALRRIVREHEAPLVLRLRAAAVLQQHGDPAGRSLVMLTARAHHSDEIGALPPDELRKLPEPDHPCGSVPAPAVDHPYDQRAARSYAIQLLPTFLHADAAPWLGELLAGDDEQDRFDSLQAIACLAQQQPGTTEALLVRVRQRHERETRRLGAVGRLVPIEQAEIPAALAYQAHSLDVGRSGEALNALLERSPASNPVLLGLLAEGSSADIRIASHLVRHPDPRAIGPLLVALERYAEVPGTSEVMIAALASCAGEESPGALAEIEPWLRWGRSWRRARALRWAGQLAFALLPFVLMVGLGRRRL